MQTLLHFVMLNIRKVYNRSVEFTIVSLKLMETSLLYESKTKDNKVNV